MKPLVLKAYNGNFLRGLLNGGPNNTGMKKEELIYLLVRGIKNSKNLSQILELKHI